MTNDHPLGPERAVFSGRWSLVRGLHRTAIMNVRPAVPGKKWSVVPGWSLVTVGGLYLQVLLYIDIKSTWPISKILSLEACTLGL